MTRKGSTGKAKPATRGGKVQRHHIGEVEGGDVTFKVTLPYADHQKLCELLALRQLSMDDLVRLAVRNMMRSAHAYALKDPFRFGKYYGEPLETIIKADPSYIDWCLCNMDGFTISEEALELLGNIKDPVRAPFTR
jgi:hypothetical protein